MSIEERCPECGELLPRDAPQGFCPACLVRAGAGWEWGPGGEQAAERGLRDHQGAPDGGSSAASSAALGDGPAPFGGYELLQELGRGGMGVVYRARQRALNRVVAIKMLLHGRFSDPAFVERFHLEAEAAAHLDHPNIVPIYEIGQHQGQPYFSMKLVEGQGLDEVIRVQSGRRGVRDAEWLRRSAGLVAKIARVVHYAHQHGVLHRDIKPHNILVDKGGEPYLTDFGLAKLLDQDSGLTLTAAVVGSPGFMAPEQAAGKGRKITTAADVYGLGAVLYAMVTGKAVFQANTPLETVRQVVEEEPVRPRVINAAVDRDLETICLKCLQKEPGKRYSSADALAEDLERWLRAEPIQARPATQLERVWLLCRRQPVRAGLTGGLVLVFALGLAGVLWQWHRATAGERLARQNAYAADINLAQRAIADNAVGLAKVVLKKHVPVKRTDPDFRGWEWSYLWQLCQPDEFVALHRCSNAVTTVAVSRKGDVLAFQWANGTALWDLPSRQPLLELTNTAWGAMALSPAGDLLAVGGWNDRRQPTAKVWSRDSRQILASFELEGKLRCLAFSEDGNLLATFDQQEHSGNLRLTDWRSRQTLTNFSMPPIRRGGVGALTFSREGSRLAIGLDAGILSVLDYRSMEVNEVKTETGDGVAAVAFSPSGKVLAASFAFNSPRIRFWDTDTLQPCGELTNHTGPVRDLAFTQDGSRLVSLGDSTLRVWSVAQMSELRRIDVPVLSCLAVLPDGQNLVAGHADGTLGLWDVSPGSKALAPGSLIVSYGMEKEQRVAVTNYRSGDLDPKVVRRFGTAWTPDARSFVTTDPEGRLAAYDARSMQVREPLTYLGSNYWAAAISPDGRLLAAGHASGQIRICNCEMRVPFTNVVTPFQWFGRLRFSPSGRFLVANVVFNDQSQRLRIWRTNDWAEIQLGKAVTERFYAPAISPDDKLLALGYRDGVVRLWSFPSGEPLATLRQNTGRTYDLRFSPDGRLLATANAGGSVGLWDVRTRRAVAVLPGHSGAAWGVAFSPDGRRLATGGDNSSEAVKLWDIATQRELLCLKAEGTFFMDLNFSPDGTTLQATSFSGIAHFWRAPSSQDLLDRDSPGIRKKLNEAAP